MDFNAFQHSYITNASSIGLDLDFYCKFSIKKVAEKFSTALGSPVEVVQWEDFTPESGKFYIKEGYGYGKERYSFVSLPLDYSSARQTLIKVFQTIKEYCYTDNTCIAQVDYSYDTNLVPELDITKLNILKFILEFNESMMWKFFPDQKDSIYVKSIKNIIPQNKFYRSENLNINSFNYILPNMKFFGANFERVKEGFIAFRYIGGKNYEYKITEALDVIAVYNSFISRSLFSPAYTDKNKSDLKSLLKNADRILKAYESYNGFVEAYPKIKLTVDLDDNVQIIKSKFTSFRDNIFNLLAASDLTEANINYDSAMSRIQIENADIHIYEIKEWEFIKCKLVVEYAYNCSFFDCELNSSSLNKCNLYRYSKAKNSRMKDTYINKTVTIEDSYIYGKTSTVEGIIDGGIVYGGRVGRHAQISDRTELIDYTKIYLR